jgi:phospholipid-binding lipoprotein MlaA
MRLSHTNRSNPRHRRIHIIAWLVLLSLFCLRPLSGSCRGDASPRSPSERETIGSAESHGYTQIAQAETDLGKPPSDEPLKPIADPLEPINRLFFQVNDRFYFWLLKPVASGYRATVPQGVRVSVRNFFSHVATPVRMANCLLQVDFKGAGIETTRFFVNTTLGLAGFFDPAKKRFNIDRAEEDFGQTLGFYGIGPILYINWPFLGPSSLRDTAGAVGDGFLDPWNYAVTSLPANLAVKSYNRVNGTSLTIGTYEDLKEAALDPYIAVRDAYHQYRRKKITE